MSHFVTAFTHARSAALAAEALAVQVEAQLGDGGEVGGGLVFATSASGGSGAEIGALLTSRWPEATLLGSSFEGVLAEGRAWRDLPAVGLMAWAAGEDEPIPVFFAPGDFEVDELAHELRDALGRPELTPDDLLLVFPDSLTWAGLEAPVEELIRLLGDPSIAGAASMGLVGQACQSWIGDEVQPGALVGLLVPGGAAARGGGVAAALPRVRCAGASRFASPWLEISACRERWVDGLEGEPPLDWVRRQLGLDRDSPVEPHLDRLLVRLRDGALCEAGESAHSIPQEPAGGDPTDFVERYVVGIDDRRGSLSVPGDYRRGGHLALALPDADHARSALRSALRALAPSPLVMQFACRARDEALHGDPDLEAALLAHDAPGRMTIGALAPFQLGPASPGGGRVLVHSTVLAALGEA